MGRLPPPGHGAPKAAPGARRRRGASSDDGATRANFPRRWQGAPRSPAGRGPACAPTVGEEPGAAPSLEVPPPAGPRPGERRGGRRPGGGRRRPFAKVSPQPSFPPSGRESGEPGRERAGGRGKRGGRRPRVRGCRWGRVRGRRAPKPRRKLSAPVRNALGEGTAVPDPKRGKAALGDVRRNLEPSAGAAGRRRDCAPGTGSAALLRCAPGIPGAALRGRSGCCEENNNKKKSKGFGFGF
ncbi:translation initiation factor IF-2-like [Gallus gallus]|uniref:translation initiation factor IF-2-like n=1 Tax=Gallus gallus TaxID=9031 RepID=UPI000739E2B2|nr:translation initiation factor IF-2-like [Gallus gallus]|eukprot:XP_015145429.1 uncharacterized protein LOC107053870 [Gallus gallus]